MPTYGGFAPLRIVATGALTTVHEARAEDGRPGRFALKVFHPAPSTQVKRLLSIEGWLWTAERQRDAARAGAAAREVVACGRCPEGAFVVLPWMPASLEGLVEGVTPTGDIARALARILLVGLESWEKGYGGPHGRLKASNVFAEGSGPLEARRVIFSDPAYQPGAVAPRELRLRDLHGVGAMVVRVIRRRAAGGWPIEAAPEWQALGRAGTPLREYCNFLLAPAPAGEVPSLAEARQRLERIPADAKPLRTAALSAAGLAVATAAGVVGLARFGSFDAMPARLVPLAERLGNPRVFRTEVAQEWAQLCRDWNAWVGDLLRFAERWEQTDALWAADDPLRAALTEFRRSAATLDPRAVVPEAAGFSLGLLGESPPEKVRQELLKSSVDRRLQAAWTRVSALAGQLAQWPRWQQVRDTRKQLSARGFPRVSATLERHHPEEAGATPDVPLLVETLNRLSEDTAGTLALLPRWGEVEALSADLTSSGDRIQKALPRLVLARVADRPSIGEFAETLVDPVEELKRHRQRFLDPSVARDRFLREAPLLQGSDEVTDEHLKAWENELESFRRVEAAQDPRQREDWNARFTALRALAVDLEPTAPAGDSTVPPLSRGDFDADLAALETRLAGLRTREVLRRDVPQLEADLDVLRLALTTLDQRVDSTLALLRPGVWLDRLAAVRWRWSPSQRRWDRWRERTLAGVSAADLEQDRARFRALRQREQTAKQWLEAFEGEQGLGALRYRAVPERSAAVNDAVQAWSERRLETLATRLIGQLWPDEVVEPAARWESDRLNESVVQSLEQQRVWAETLPGLVETLDRLSGHLARGEGWNEGVAPLAMSLRSRQDLGELAGAPALWWAEAQVLESLNAGATRAQVLAAAQGGGFSSRLEAWRRLGAEADWPATVADLDTDGSLTEALGPAIAAAPLTEARRGALTQELERETQRRWNRAARQVARNETDLMAVFSRMDRFGIAAHHLDSDVGYNLRLWQLKQARGDEGDTDYWRARRDAFVAQARGAPAIAQHPEVARLLAALEALPLRDDPSRTTSRSPARAGWRESLADGGQRVRVTWGAPGREVAIEFQLVQPKDGTHAFYLARQALSVGDFIELMSRRPEGGGLFETMPRWVLREGDGNEPWTVPLAWRPRADRTGLELNGQWIYRPDAQVAPLLETRTGASEPALEALVRERPVPRSPLQRISPGLAREFVERVLGARLLTPDEWKAFVADLPAPPQSNLRDRTFSQLWRFLEGYRTADQVISWRPNQDIYLPLQPTEQGGRTRRLPMSDPGTAPPDRDDTRLWPAPVDDGPETAGFIHLFGNVWTYLYDPVSQRYFVGGGSALAPPALDPKAPHPVEGVPLIGNSRGRALVDGFSDVGVRPAFDAPPGLRDRMEMFRLVRLQQFLTL
ncbi:MAG: phage tail tape measure protein [Opitutaceae bacterium]|nr:phage tail tape measure protein [Opitutaceae bacterium]